MSARGIVPVFWVRAMEFPVEFTPEDRYTLQEFAGKD
jgi:hypothetical protein